MSNTQMIQMLFVLLLCTLIILSVLHYFLRRFLIEKQKYTIFTTGKKGKNTNVLIKYYDFFSQWFLTKNYIKKITLQYEIQMPGDSKTIANNTMKLAIRIWIIDLILIILLFARSPTLYSAILTLTFLFISNHQIFYTVVEKSEIKLLKQLGGFLGSIRHNYQKHGMIDEAIYDSLEKAEYPIKLHGEKIYEILNAADVEEEVSKYNEHVPNRFLKTLLALCVLMVTYGDKQVDNQSLFLTNIKYLKQEIDTEILKRDRIVHLFSGLILIGVTPVLFLHAIENWAVKSLPELESYYHGAFGIITVVLIFISTLLSYTMINRMKENKQVEQKNYILLDYFSKIPVIKKMLNRIINKNYGKTLKIQALISKTGEPITCKEFLLKRLIYGIITFFCCIFLSFFIHSSNKNQLVTNINNLDYLSSAISKQQIDTIQESIKNYVNQYKKSAITVEAIEIHLQEDGFIQSKQYLTMTANEIVRRINGYHNEYYKWYELLLAIFMGVAAYQGPYIYLIFLKKLRQMNMEDEIIQYHSIILMLMYLERINIDVILSWLENFAVIFKNSIQDCRNNLWNGDLEVLEELKFKEPFEPFVKIIENLQMSDKIGLKKAFDEIAVERYHYQEKRKLENEIYMNDRALLGKVIAFIPFFITIGLYLIVPFIVEGLAKYSGYMEQIQSIY